MRIVVLILMMSCFLYPRDFKNDLQYESSPYLRQHASNPVAWFAWGKKALALAKKEDKPIFLSIGYSTCHWCHVMAQESFQNKEIAKILNKYFISIKVDKEEMPHLDAYYQSLFVKVKQRNGGWPLNVILTSDAKPLYFFTYMPPKKRYNQKGLDVFLREVGKKYKDDPQSVLKRVKQLEVLIDTKNTPMKNTQAKISAKTLQDSFYESYDEISAGFGEGAKFPQSAKLELMFDVAQLQNDTLLQHYYFETLNMMALRGLYDHVDGGFFRYCVDSDWRIPHFEKMLYTQAKLIPLYVKGYIFSGKTLYKNVVIETISMLEERFSNQNLYYSASDAVLDSKEGGYFLFSHKELLKSLKNNTEKKSLLKALHITKNGNFKGETQLNIYTDKRPKGFDKLKKKLKIIRKTKEYPFVDKKINTAWNAMMIEALFLASKIDEKYLVMANEHLDALVSLMFDKGQLYHQTLLGHKPKEVSYLEDYSFFISALLVGYSIDFDHHKLDFAQYLFETAKTKFYKNNIWYLSDDALKIKADHNDKYYTSALAKMIQNALHLASLKSSFKYEALAIKTLESINETIEQKQTQVPASAKAFLMVQENIVTLKSSKTNLQKHALEIFKIKYPFLLTKATQNENYIACTMRSCFSINKDFKKIVEGIEHRK